MSKKLPITVDALVEFVRTHAGKKSTDMMADETGVSVERIVFYAAANGISLRLQSKMDKSKRIEEEIIASEGKKKAVELAKTLNCSPYTIVRYAQRLNVALVRRRVYHTRKEVATTDQFFKVEARGNWLL